MSEWRKIWANGLPDTGKPKNQAIGWLRKECCSPGGGTVVRFSRMWVSSGECRYKYVALGLIFLKYISDTFAATHAMLSADDLADPEGS